jgi:hypothetical protein
MRAGTLILWSNSEPAARTLTFELLGSPRSMTGFRFQRASRILKQRDTWRKQHRAHGAPEPYLICSLFPCSCWNEANWCSCKTGPRHSYAGRIPGRLQTRVQLRISVALLQHGRAIRLPLACCFCCPCSSAGEMSVSADCFRDTARFKY